MLTGMTDVRTADAAKRLGVETTGIEIIDEADRVERDPRRNRRRAWRRFLPGLSG